MVQEDIIMLEITKVVASSTVSYQGCGKYNDYDCGRNARNG